MASRGSIAVAAPNPTSRSSSDREPASFDASTSHISRKCLPFGCLERDFERYASFIHLAMIGIILIRSASSSSGIETSRWGS
jgi:hypothetical protein